MSDHLFRITAPGEGAFKDRGSRFIGFAFPVETPEQIQTHLEEVRRKYHDARHHCYAWRLGMYGDTSQANDDGEPAHSAGAPILGAIRSGELTDCLVVVVRYFGGTKLGVRGLIEAYRAAALDALEGLPRLELVPRVTFQLIYEYQQTSDINRILHPFELVEVESLYTERVVQTLAIEKTAFPPLQAQLEASLFNWKILQED